MFEEVVEELWFISLINIGAKMVNCFLFIGFLDFCSIAPSHGLLELSSHPRQSDDAEHLRKVLCLNTQLLCQASSDFFLLEDFINEWLCYFFLLFN